MSGATRSREAEDGAPLCAAPRGYLLLGFLSAFADSAIHNSFKLLTEEELSGPNPSPSATDTSDGTTRPLLI